MLGFAFGPAVWAPISELYGRYISFAASHAMLVAFVATSAASRNMTTLLITRFLSGFFGAPPITNSGGVIADLFAAQDRGLSMSVYSAAPFLGPVLGPLVGGFVTMNLGWRWVQGVCCIFIGVVFFAGLLIPETYMPVLLHRKAKRLSEADGKVYVSVLKTGVATTKSGVFSKAIKRPWVMLFMEPIVLIASVYVAILVSSGVELQMV